MRHHFADLLDRDADYWTITPNRERYAYGIGDVPAGSRDVTIVTIGKDEKNWARVFTLPNLEELTLHEPSTEQLHSVGELRSVKRLRITHVRPDSVEFLAPLEQLEELVLEYVSGFNSLAPLQALKRLRALHLENLRRVSDFGGLSGVVSLRYLSIRGTLDWKQPIGDFEFLHGLPNLEVLALWQFINKTPFPAFLPAHKLKKLRKLNLGGSFLPTREYALLEQALEGVEGANWGPFRTTAHAYLELPHNDIRAHLPEDAIRKNHPEVILRFDGKREITDPNSEWFEFTGKSAGSVKCSSPNAESKCKEFALRYASMKEEAKGLLVR
jgi:hypothetical protein